MNAKLEILLKKKIFGRELGEGFYGRALFVLLCAALYIWVYAPVLGFQPLGDDLTFLYSNEVIQNGLNPFLFWMRGNVHTKAWPFFYTVIWFSHRIASDPVILDHLLSVLLHFTNGLLLIRICTQLRLRYALAAGPLVWFHPAHLLTVSQIMLLSKILSSFAFLLWLKTFAESAGAGAPETPLSYGKRFLFLCLSLFSAGQSYLLSLIEWREFVARRGLVSAMKLAGLFLLVSAYGGGLAAHGVVEVERMVARNVRAVDGQSASFRTIVPERIPVSEKVISTGQSEQEPAAPLEDVPFFAKSWSWAWDYLCGTLGFDSALGGVPWAIKLRNVGITSLFYLKMFLVPVKIGYSLELAEMGDLAQNIFILLGLAVLGAAAYVFYSGRYLWEALLFSYLPVSGVFFVPFTSHIDLVSARYAYLPFLPAIILTLRWLEARPRWCGLLLCIWIAGLTLLAVLDSRTPGLYHFVNPN